ncbi:MAG: hypothetical protein JWN14_4914, partial [Chthonomonadales bacterium]|nr:hypothetical protein [Chthonomonadales bacterium]
FWFTLLLLLCVWLAAPTTVLAQTNPTISPGSNATFPKTGTVMTNSYPWDIVRAGSTVATAGSTNGWSVSYNNTTMQFTVGAPANATVATGYAVRFYYYPSGAASATFNVDTPVLQLSAVSASPNPVIGGNTSTGTVTLSQAAPTGGITVTLSSNNSGVASVPSSVTVAQGQTTATFTITTTTVSTPATVTLSGSYNSVTQTTMLTVNPVPVFSALSVSPSSVIGGTSATGTATLTYPAGTGGVSVSLSSNNTAAATTPASVTIAAGQTSATFTVTTSAVTAPTSVTLTGVSGGVTKTAALTVSPTNLTGFSLSPGSASMGQTVTGYLQLSSAAPTGGASVAISCSNSQAATFPAAVSVPAGQSSTSFSIVTSTVNYPITVTFTASYGVNSFTAQLTLYPGNLRLTDLLAPYTAKLTWDCQATGNFILKRDSVTIATLANSVTTYTDAFATGFTNGQAYYYEIFDSAAPTVHLSATKIVPYQVGAIDNQAVDSRLDLRYATNVFLDHAFGSTFYRGGLFVGYSGDPSRIGRSYAKFNLVAPGSGVTYRTGNLNAYCTGALTSGNQTVSMLVNCQTLTDLSWQGSSMVWSTPTNLNLDPTHNDAQATVSYNPTLTPPTPGWIAWSMPIPLLNALATPSTPYAVAWTSSDEAGSGWAYFAKREFDSNLAPAATYAYEQPIPIKMTFTPNTLTGGGTVQVSLNVNGVGLGDSTVVALSETHSGTTTVTNFPTSVTVTGLSRTFSFQVSTPPGGCTFNAGPPSFYTPYAGPGGLVNVSASCNGVTVWGTLTIQGSPAPAHCP